jgi:hypothetical protein
MQLEAGKEMELEAKNHQMNGIRQLREYAEYFDESKALKQFSAELKHLEELEAN